jgi:hypothetical protein
MDQLFQQRHEEGMLSNSPSRWSSMDSLSSSGGSKKFDTTPTYKHCKDDDSSSSSSFTSTPQRPLHHTSSSPAGCLLRKDAPSPNPAVLDSIPTKPKRKQSVHFDESVTVCLVKPWTEYKGVSRDDIWISAEESTAVKLSILQSVAESRQSGKSSIYELRGLEGLLPSALRRKQLSRAILQDTVLDEQDVVDAYSLAKMASALSAENRKEALERAKIDAQLASLI